MYKFINGYILFIIADAYTGTFGMDQWKLNLQQNEVL